MERRRSPRFSAQHQVLIQLVSEPEIGLFGLSQNISAAGVRFVTDSPPRVGSDVQVTFFLPNARASALGAVVRIDEESGGRFGIAVACKQPFEGALIPASIRTS